MELRQIRYFAEAARLGHFTRAAEAMRVSQPSLSQQIRTLESELGMDLFDRTGRRVRLTSAGETFLVRARRILEEVESARTEIQEFSDLLRGRVTVGALQSAVGSALARLLVAFEELYPGVELNLREQQITDPMLEMLASGELDLAVGHASGIEMPRGLAAAPLFTEDLVLIISPEHPLSERKRVSLGELKTEPFITFAVGSGIRNTLVAACLQEGFTPRIAFESGATRTLVSQGLGVSLVPRSFTEAEGPQVTTLEVLGTAPLTRTVAIFWDERRRLAPTITALLQFVKSHRWEAQER
jgi:DNA-binding transcriptional LysR family regulator